MRKFRPIKSFLAIGWFVLLLTACSFVHPAVGSAPHATSIPLGTIFRSYRAPFSVFAAAWSPDGKRIASSSSDNTVQVWDATSGKLVYTYRGNSDTVSAVAWSPDGKRMASGCSDHTVRVWDATTGAHTLTYRGHTS